VQPRGAGEANPRCGDAALVYHSATQKAFDEVSAEDNSCAIVTWGRASIQLTAL
jgi:hypothetical protein